MNEGLYQLGIAFPDRFEEHLDGELDPTRLECASSFSFERAITGHRRLHAVNVLSS
ncbi:MAG: hypothetical protein AB1625_14145 [Acidobacteriota bacterium]